MLNVFQSEALFINFIYLTLLSFNNKSSPEPAHQVPSRSCQDLNHGRPSIGELLAGTKGRTPDLLSDDEGGSFAAGRARKSLSLPGRFHYSS